MYLIFMFLDTFPDSPFFPFFFLLSIQLKKTKAQYLMGCDISNDFICYQPFQQ